MRLAELTARASRLRSEGTPPTFAEIVGEDQTLEDLSRLWLDAATWKTAANLVERVVGDELAARLDGQSLEVDGFLVFAKKGTTSEKCIDHAGFWSAVEGDPHISRYFNPDYAKKGSLPPAVRDTFFEKSETVKPEAVERPVSIPVEVLETNRQKRTQRG